MAGIAGESRSLEAARTVVAWATKARLEADDVTRPSQRAKIVYLSMILSGNRFPFFGIMP